MKRFVLSMMIACGVIGLVHNPSFSQENQTQSQQQAAPAPDTQTKPPQNGPAAVPSQDVQARQQATVQTPQQAAVQMSQPVAGKEPPQAPAAVPQVPLQASQQALQPGADTSSDVQWLWGDVVSLDLVTKEITVKYVDYDTDTQKEAVIQVDDKTSFENVGSLSDIKAADKISVDYIIASDGKKIANKVSLEKLDDTESLDEPDSKDAKQ